MYYMKLFILGSTPRAIYNIKYTLRTLAWGTLFPSITVLVVISTSCMNRSLDLHSLALFTAIAYSIISPIINGLSAITFFLFYQMYKYLFVWQIGGEKADETGGLFFPRAIQHVFVGLYLQQVSLATLFFLAENDKGRPSAVVEGALVIVLIAFTVSTSGVTLFTMPADRERMQALFHVIINNSYGPLKHHLPLTLADSTLQAIAEDPNAAAAGQELEIQAEDVEDVERARATSAEASASAVEQKEDVQESIRGVDEEPGPKDFYHPASVDPQPIIWLPHDPFGFAEAEERAMRAVGIEASTRDAVMDIEGRVDISGPPPEQVQRQLRDFDDS